MRAPRALAARPLAVRLAASALAGLIALPATLPAQTAADALRCDRQGDARHPEAKAQVRQMAQGSTPEATFHAGCAALFDGQASRAADLFEKVVQANDANPIAHFWLGRAYGDLAEKANVFKQASLARKTKAQFDHAVQLDPAYLDAREGLMQYYLLAPGILGGSVDRAREQVQEIRRRDAYRGGFAAARLATRQKDTTTLAREYRQLVAQYPDSGAPWTSLITMLVVQRHWDEAFETTDRLTRAQPESRVAPYLVGRLAAESGQQLERGEQALRRYLTTTPRPGEPTLANAHYRLGGVLERQGRRDQARAEYQAAVSLDPKLKPARDALAKLG